MDQEVGYGITNDSARSYKAWRRIMRSLDVHSRKLYQTWNITSPQIHCLHTLSANNQHTLSSLAENLHLSSSTTNGIIDRLELKGLVRRERVEKDQRKVNLVITDMGCDILKSVPELMRDIYTEAVNRFSREEQHILSELLLKLADNLDPINSLQLIPSDYDTINSAKENLVRH